VEYPCDGSTQRAKYKTRAKIASAKSSGCTITPPAIEITKRTMARISSTQIGLPALAGDETCAGQISGGVRVSVILRQADGFEGLPAVVKPFGPKGLSVAERDYKPKVVHDAGAAGLAPHLSPLVRHDFVVPSIDEFDVLIGALLPRLVRLHIEVPGGIGTADRVDLRPHPAGDGFKLRITQGYPSSPVAPIEGVQRLAQALRVLL
jgi:hypothetical protein